MLEFLDFIGGARFAVDSFRVEAVHLDVVDELLHDHRHGPLVAGQTGHFYSKLPGGELGVELPTITENQGKLGIIRAVPDQIVPHGYSSKSGSHSFTLCPETWVT